jgi:hypothetical protein
MKLITGTLYGPNTQGDAIADEDLNRCCRVFLMKAFARSWQA